MGTADVAVIIPVHNRRTMVLDALRSVAQQSLRPRRLIVVDDGSTDGTSNCVDEWLKRANLKMETHLLRQAAAGVSAARNHGMRYAGNCRFLAFLDSDDLWPSDFLQRTIHHLEQNPKAVAASCDRLAINHAKFTRRRERLAGIAKNATRWLFTKHAGIASCTLFRAEAVGSLNGYDEKLATGEDAELFLRLSLLGPWMYAAGQPVAFRTGLAQSHGEQSNVSRHNPENNLVWAQIYEGFIRSYSPSHLISAREVRFHLAKRWYRAGRQLAATGRFGESLQCYRRSCSWRNWNKAWLHLAVACFTKQGFGCCVGAVK
jgi:glycosyltransferase involved in cell wall biosynthesis